LVFRVTEVVNEESCIWINKYSDFPQLWCVELEYQNQEARLWKLIILVLKSIVFSIMHLSLSTAIRNSFYSKYKIEISSRCYGAGAAIGRMMLSLVPIKTSTINQMLLSCCWDKSIGIKLEIIINMFQHISFIAYYCYFYAQQQIFYLFQKQW